LHLPFQEVEEYDPQVALNSTLISLAHVFDLLGKVFDIDFRKPALP
jgi:hypothetical protein